MKRVVVMFLLGLIASRNASAQSPELLSAYKNVVNTIKEYDITSIDIKEIDGLSIGSGLLRFNSQQLIYDGNNLVFRYKQTPADRYAFANSKYWKPGSFSITMPIDGSSTEVSKAFFSVYNYYVVKIKNSNKYNNNNYIPNNNHNHPNKKKPTTPDLNLNHRQKHDFLDFNNNMNINGNFNNNKHYKYSNNNSSINIANNTMPNGFGYTGGPNNYKKSNNNSSGITRPSTAPHKDKEKMIKNNKNNYQNNYGRMPLRHNQRPSSAGGKNNNKNLYANNYGNNNMNKKE